MMIVKWGIRPTRKIMKLEDKVMMKTSLLILKGSGDWILVYLNVVFSPGKSDDGHPLSHELSSDG